MWWRALKYILVGLIFWLVATLLLAASTGFIERSEPAQLVVLHMERKTDEDGTVLYRPVFTLDTDERPRPEYRGHTWISFLVHKAGEVVPGRYDKVTGAMDSDRMISISRWFYRIMQLIGLLSILQGVMMFLGVPEHLLPLRLRNRS
jgi:hypothetical protein